MTFKTFVTRYAWSGPIVAFVIVSLLGTGVIWQYFELRLKSRNATIEQIRAEKELYERLQLLQHQASDAIPRYIALRDRFFSALNDRDVSSAYQAEKAKLLGLVREYNRLEAKLSTMEVRSPRFFVLPLSQMAPRNFRVEAKEDGSSVLKWDSSSIDPLVIEVKKDLRDLFHQYGKGVSR